MNVRTILSDPGYPELKSYILNHTGLGYYSDKDEDLAARLSRRLTLRGVGACGVYLRKLTYDRAEMEGLIGELTIGETYFFRQREHFDLLRERVIPDLLERNQSSRCLRIWSAGCATGAEPYSIALVLRREFASRIEGWDVSILATDINVDFLARAAHGVFADWALRETPEEVKATCFVHDGKQWLLRPPYRQGITFEYHNLASITPIPKVDTRPFDLIVCRNVMIYFLRDRMQAVVNRFYDALGEGGWLLVGHAEPSADIFHQFQVVCNQEVTAYFKSSAAPAAAAVKWQPWKESDAPAKVAVAEKPAAPVPDGNALASSDARLLADRGEWKAAAEVCYRLIEAHATDAAAHFTLGLILEQTASPEEAQSELRRAIFLDRSFVLAHYHLASSLQRTQRTLAARRSFRNVLDLLAGRPGQETVEHGDGITIDELRELSKMHLELLT